MRNRHEDLWKMAVCAAVMSRQPVPIAVTIADNVVAAYETRFPDERPDTQVEVRG